MKTVFGLPPKATRKDVAAIDVEIFGLDSRRMHRPEGTLACLQTTLDGKTVYMINDEQRVPAFLNRLWNARWVLHNAQFDLRHLLRWAKIPKHPDLWDSLLIERIMYAGWYDSFTLADLARRYLGKVLDKSVRDSFHDATALTPEQIKYAAEDACITWNVYRKQSKARDIDFAYKVWKEIDEPALWAVLDFKGFHVNLPKLAQLSEGAAVQAQRIERRLKFNPRSPTMVRQALAERHINVASTKESVLEAYAGDPVVDAILECRGLSKLVSTYGDQKIAEFLDEQDDLYGEFNVTGASTGRMSSNSPNMQNFPRQKEWREPFEAHKGNRLIIADYHQQEPRVLAAVSGDAALLQAIERGEDLHLTVARAIYNDQTIQKKDPRRQAGKTVNLATSYGMTEYGLSLALDITQDDARDFLDSYFRRFSGVRAWIDRQHEEGERVGYVSTASGRRFHLNTYTKHWGNNAINSPIQGGAADLTKLALGLMHKHYGSKLPVVSIIHDEFVLEVPAKEARKHAKVVERCMREAYTRLYPQVSNAHCVELTIGRNWADKK